MNQYVIKQYSKMSATVESMQWVCGVHYIMDFSLCLETLITKCWETYYYVS